MLLLLKTWHQEMWSAERWLCKSSEEEELARKRITFTCISTISILLFSTNDCPELQKQPRSSQTSMSPKSPSLLCRQSTTTWEEFLPITGLKSPSWWMERKWSFLAYWLQEKLQLLQCMGPTDLALTRSWIWLSLAEQQLWQPKIIISQDRHNLNWLKMLENSPSPRLSTSGLRKESSRLQRFARKCKGTCKETLQSTEQKRLFKKDAIRLTKFMQPTPTSRSTTRALFGTLTYSRLFSLKTCFVSLFRFSSSQADHPLCHPPKVIARSACKRRLPRAWRQKFHEAHQFDHPRPQIRQGRALVQGCPSPHLGRVIIPNSASKEESLLINKPFQILYDSIK